MPRGRMAGNGRGGCRMASTFTRSHVIPARSLESSPILQPAGSQGLPRSVPRGLDDSLVALGKPLFDTHCSSCHAVQSSVDVPGAWRTPVVAVGTDPKMALNSARMSDAGLLTGALMPPPAIGARIGNPAKAADILANTGGGGLLAAPLVH